MDVPARTVSGLTPSAKALFVAGAAHSMPHGVALFIVPSDGDLEEAVADTAFFLAALEGLSGAAADRAVLPFPSHEVDPYRGLAPHVGVTSARARALHALASGTARVIVASASALLPRVSAPERLLAASFELAPGKDIAPDALGELLVDAGFSREDPADEHGEFAIRGGILDVYPAGEPEPVRLEFIGDTIESLRTYDPGTQRSIKAIDRFTIVPLRDVLPIAAGKIGATGVTSPEDFGPALVDRPETLADRSATLAEYLTRGKSSRVIVSERDEVESNAIKLVEQVQHSYEEAVAKARDEDVTPPAELFADWEDIRARLEQATELAQLGLGDTAEV